MGRVGEEGVIFCAKKVPVLVAYLIILVFPFSNVKTIKQRIVSILDELCDIVKLC